MGKQWKQCQTLFLGGSKITADGDCSHGIKGRLLLGEGNVNPLQYSCLENPMDGGAWRATVHGTLKSLLQHHRLNASILQRSAFFTVQLSHPYMTTGKTTALTRWTFVGKVMSLLLNMLSRLVINFLPRISYYNKSEECLKFEKILPDPLP